MTSGPVLHLQGFTFTELLNSEGLLRLDQVFLSALKAHDETLYQTLLTYRKNQLNLSAIEKSEFIIQCGIFLETFLAKLFNIEDALAMSKAKTISENPISLFKKYFVLRRAKKEITRAKTFLNFDELNAWLHQQLEVAALKTDDQEMTVALLANQYLNAPEQYESEIEKLVQWCTQALISPEGKTFTKDWVSFRIPERQEPKALVKAVSILQDEHTKIAAPIEKLRLRDGFKLTDPRMNAREVQDEVNYCIYCHDHDGDFCSKGFPVKKGEPDLGFKKNALDVILTGCPLEEKISEMNYLKKDGFTLAALSVVMIDNPMCPATGHRICNDCMKSCIYQKQDPVNIPQIETRVLTDVLNLPWGVEIYDLLTRWNPLREHQWCMKPYNGLKVMIAGMGPAGFTLAHHLLLEGFAVVGFDGLKIEPLDEKLLHQPIYSFKELKESLDERLMAGFGGVAEYGITVRWDKNFLKLIYLSLLRRPYFQVFGGVRFGGTIKIEDAWELGFDHFAVAVGAGLPKALSIPRSLAPGMRQANDFLMALQLGNAAKDTSMTNLQIRLPAVVIGGGLTGVDTATELQAYYIKQVEKVLTRYEILVQAYGEAFVSSQIDTVSRNILNEYLKHGLSIREERALAQQENRLPNFIKLIHNWGGVTIVYRRSMQESPAYINNHEELQKALYEGIFYAEGLEPISVILDDHGYAQQLICKKRIRNEDQEWISTEEEMILSAKAILVATGTQPNTAYEFEHRGTFNRLNFQYQHYEAHENQLEVAHGVLHCKDKSFGPFTSYQKNDKRVSLIGDTHPVFHGNVVKAIASGMRTYPKILALFKDELNRQGDQIEYQNFANKIRDLFKVNIENILRRSHDKLEITIKAPLAAKHFKAGQFFRLQNFETYSKTVMNTLMQMEPLALVPAAHDVKEGTLKFIISEKNASTKICATLKLGDPITLMGPTGVRAKIPSERESVLIIGDSASFAFVQHYATTLRAANNRILFVCCIKNRSELYCQSELEAVCDTILWVSEEDEIEPIRSQDMSILTGNYISALINYAQLIANKSTLIPLSDIDRVFITGESNLLRLFQINRRQLVKEHFIKDPKVFGSVYGNMQCMLKGVCAQCLQWQIDPESGRRSKAVFACSWQDQPLELIDIDHLDERIKQNSLLETLSNLWIEHVFKKSSIDRI